jgi:hypothetical protein
VPYQEVRVWARKRGTGSDPTCAVEIYETGGVSGAPLATPIPATPVPSTTGVLLSGVFDAAVLADATGAALEARVVGTGAAGGALEVGAVKWNAALLPGGGTLERAASYAVTPELARARDVNKPRSYLLTLSLSRLREAARVRSYLATLVRPGPVKEARVSRVFDAPLSFSGSRSLTYARLASFVASPLFSMARIFTTSRTASYLATLSLTRAREVARVRNYLLTPILSRARNVERVLAYLASPAHSAPKELRPAPKGYVLAPSFSAARIFTTSRTASYLATLSFGRTRIVERARNYLLTPSLSRTRRLERFVDYVLSPYGSVAKEVRPVARSYVVTPSFLPPARLKSVIRAVSYLLTPSLTRNRAVERARNYLLTPTLSRVRAVSRALARTGTLAFGAFKTTNRVVSFSLSLVYTPLGALSGAVAAAKRNVEVFMQVLRGRRGTIPLTYRIVRSSPTGEDLGPVPGVIAGTGSVSMSNARDHAWELRFDMKQDPRGVFDPVRDYVKIYADIEMAGDKESYPLGLYRLAKPSGVIRKSLRTWACTGFSLEDLLARHETDDPYWVPKNTDVLLRARDLIVEKAGVPAERVLFPAASATLRYGVLFDPTNDSTGASWLAVINALLNAAGYYALQTDAEGNFTTEKMGSRTVLEPDVSYDEGYERMVAGSIADDWDDDRFANKVVVRSQDVAETPPLVAKAYNRNPESLGSIDYLGRTVQKTINLQTAVSLAEMQTMAQAELEKASGYYRKLSVSHLFDPRCFAPRRVYGLYLTDELDGNAVVDGIWNQINGSVNLSKPATPMTSEISRIESV